MKKLVIYLMSGHETPALEPAHALARARELEEDVVLVCLSGRGDKDLAEVLAKLDQLDG